VKQEEERPHSKQRSFWPSNLQLPEKIVITIGLIALCVALYFIFTDYFSYPTSGLLLAVAALFIIAVCVFILIYVIQGIRKYRARRK